VDGGFHQTSAVVTVLVDRAVTAYFVANHPPAMPVCVSPSGGQDVSINPLLWATLFSDSDSGDTHAASAWQIAGSDGDFGAPVYGVETAPASLYPVPPGTLAYTTYFWRVRYKDNHDGWSDWSTPAAFDAVLTVDEIKHPSGGTVRIAWPTQAGYLYTLCSATNLAGGPWTQVQGFIDVPGTNGVMSYDAPSGSGRTFYCVGVQATGP
jgi:hypothetical protein